MRAICKGLWSYLYSNKDYARDKDAKGRRSAIYACRAARGILTCTRGPECTVMSSSKNPTASHDRSGPRARSLGFSNFPLSPRLTRDVAMFPELREPDPIGGLGDCATCALCVHARRVTLGAFDASTRCPSRICRGNAIQCGTEFGWIQRAP